MRFPMLSLGLASALAACTGTVPRTPAATAADSPGGSTPNAPERDHARSAGTPAAPAETAPPVPSSEPEPEAAASNQAASDATDAMAPRQVTYRTSPESLVIEVDGLRLIPQAVPVHFPNGSYGVRVEVTIEARDDSSHHLLAPTQSALSFFSRVFDKRGNLVAEHTDQRAGNDTRIISPGMKEVLTRAWPADTKAGVVWWGQSLRLEVGLWGLGRVDAERRPLKRLFVVELKATAQPKARILPPDLP